MKLTDQEVIRKAVEQADGWTWKDREPKEFAPGIITRPVPFITTQSGYGSNGVEEQEVLDALAAQLVRQVVSMEGFEVVVCNGEAAVMSPTCECIGDAQGPDRTMNTLRCITEWGGLAK